MALTDENANDKVAFISVKLAFEKTLARLFKTNDVVSSRVIKISNVTISNMPIFFVEKM